GDCPYTTLEGNDIFPECFIGRISIESPTDMMVFLSKMNQYERDVDVNLSGSSAWYSKSLLVGDDWLSGVSTYYTNHYVKAMILSHDPNHTFSEHYGYQVNPSHISNGINNGALFFNYRGLEYLYGFSVVSINALTNYNELTNVSILTCNTGTFSNIGPNAGSVSWTEAFVRAGTPASPKGAICALGMATEGTHTRYNNPLNGGTYEGLYAYGMSTMGEAMVRGELALYMGFHNSSWNAVQFFTHWHNLIGDPSLDIWKTLPIPLNVTHDATINNGTNYMQFSVADDQGTPLDNCWVTVRSDDETLYATGYTDATGQVELVFSNGYTGDAGIVVTKPNYIPYLGDVTVSALGGVGIAQTILDDDNTGSSSGNNNGNANPGETIELNLELQNYATTDYTGINATLTTADPFITIVNGTANVGDIASGQTSTAGFVIQIAPGVYNNYVCNLSVDITDSGGSIWTNRLDIEIDGIDLDVQFIALLDGNDGILDPGEQTDVDVHIINNGAMWIFDVNGTLRSLTPYITVNDSAATFGDFYINGQHSAIFSITASSFLIPGSEIQLELELYNADGYSEFEVITIPIGQATVTDPLGPDAGGYMCFDDGDAGYLGCPVYNWIEINPALGASGTNTGLSDTGENDDEIVTLNMPFPFQFYGEDYTEISICSNGFITFCATPQATNRNWPLPGPLGPSPMIAPFWDELITGGGTYTWYDTTNNLYVIEWYEAHIRGYSQNETFQIILYDPAHYPTSNGDGIVKFQYLEVHNIDASMSTTNGNYATVGIENGDTTIGIQFTYNLEYPPAAKHLQNQMAIVFIPTTNDVDDAYLTIGDVIVHNADGNGQVESGETVNLGISLNNIGLSAATGVQAVLSSNSPMVTVTQNTATYPDLAAVSTDFNLQYFQIAVQNGTPAGTTLDFNISATANNSQWDYPFSLNVSAPNVTYVSHIVDDSNGNGDGAPDSGETFNLAISLENQSLTDAYGVQMDMSTTSTLATVFSGPQNYGDIPSLAIIQKLYQVQITTSSVAGETIPFVMSISGTGIPAFTETFSITVSQPSGFGQPGMISGNITLSGGNSSVEDVVITCGIYGTHPDNIGDYTFFTPPGNRTLRAELDYYEAGEVDLAVIPGGNTTGTDITLNHLEPPANLTALLTGNTVTLSWFYNPVTVQREIFSHFYVYRQRETGPFEVIDSISVETAQDIIDLNRLYKYYIVAIYDSGVSDSTNHLSTADLVPEQDDNVNHITNLEGNYPNPFNPVTAIRFSLKEEADVSLQIYNIRGQKVRTLVRDKLQAGTQIVEWQGVNDEGSKVASGIYFYRLKVGAYDQTRKMLLLK
ncbi:MAG: T9SS type A sorting domain-containing protein, partial [Candidatus Cloacimonetes bacterium]|nr:T9SS type A sorting domain-containing protein [Candidatus Cloacimonadota bacterium]